MLVFKKILARVLAFYYQEVLKEWGLAFKSLQVKQINECQTTTWITCLGKISDFIFILEIYTIDIPPDETQSIEESQNRQDTRQKLSKMFVGLGDVLGVLRADPGVSSTPFSLATNREVVGLENFKRSKKGRCFKGLESPPLWGPHQKSPVELLEIIIAKR